MRFLDASEFEALIAGARLLREDGYGPKVYETPEGRIVKLFRIKRWLSSSVLYPYSVRFARNSRRLQRMGIPCVTVDFVFYCHAIRRHGLVYRRMDGTPLDQLLTSSGEQAQALYRAYGEYIASLHQQRIVFRSLHPGNILRLPGGGFGLIDVADMRFPRCPLTLARRRRNFQHLFRSDEFGQVQRVLPVQILIDAYLEAAGLPASDCDLLSAQLHSDIEALGKAA